MMTPQRPGTPCTFSSCLILQSYFPLRIHVSNFQNDVTEGWDLNIHKIANSRHIPRLTVIEWTSSIRQDLICMDFINPLGIEFWQKIEISFYTPWLIFPRWSFSQIASYFKEELWIELFLSVQGKKTSFDSKRGTKEYMGRKSCCAEHCDNGITRNTQAWMSTRKQHNYHPWDFQPGSGKIRISTMDTGQTYFWAENLKITSAEVTPSPKLSSSFDRGHYPFENSSEHSVPLLLLHCVAYIVSLHQIVLLANFHTQNINELRMIYKCFSLEFSSKLITKVVQYQFNDGLRCWDPRGLVVSSSGTHRGMGNHSWAFHSEAIFKLCLPS